MTARRARVGRLKRKGSLMTEVVTNDPEVLNSAKPAGLRMFLDLAVQRGDLPQARGTNLRVAARKVLDVAGDEDLDLRTVNLDELFHRFHIKSRVDLSDASRQTYEKRFRDAVDMYLRSLNDDQSWKTPQRKPKSGMSTRRATMPVSVPEAEEASVLTISGTRLTKFPVPLRRGVEAQLCLPDDLTEHEAKRISKIVEALAGREQPQLPPGESAAS